MATENRPYFGTCDPTDSRDRRMLVGRMLELEDRRLDEDEVNDLTALAKDPSSPSALRCPALDKVAEQTMDYGEGEGGVRGEMSLLSFGAVLKKLRDPEQEPDVEVRTLAWQHWKSIPEELRSSMGGDDEEAGGKADPSPRIQWLMSLDD